MLLSRKGDFAAAEGFLREALALRIRLMGPKHPRVTASRLSLATVLMEHSKWNDADELLLAAIETERAGRWSENPQAVDLLVHHARCLLAKERSAAAEGVLVEAAELFEGARLRAGAGVARAAGGFSPYFPLAATRLRQGKTQGAWLAVERSLGRALGDLLLAAGQRLVSPEDTSRKESLQRSVLDAEARVAVLEEAARANRAGATAGQLEEAKVLLDEMRAAWHEFRREMDCTVTGFAWVRPPAPRRSARLPGQRLSIGMN